MGLASKPKNVGEGLGEWRVGGEPRSTGPDPGRGSELSVSAQSPMWPRIGPTRFGFDLGVGCRASGVGEGKWCGLGAKVPPEAWPWLSTGPVPGPCDTTCGP